MNDVYLSLGSNIGNRELFLHDAIEALGNDANILIDKTADFYETSPVGNVEQRPFVNTAVKIATTYTPQQLIRFIHEIEQGLHRTRTIHWGPRTIDIDIIFFGDQQINTKELTVPHPEAFNRLFVLVPILEIIDKEFPSFQKIESTIAALKDKDQTIQKMTSNENYKGTLQASVRQLLQQLVKIRIGRVWWKPLIGLPECMVKSFHRSELKILMTTSYLMPQSVKVPRWSWLKIFHSIPCVSTI